VVGLAVSNLLRVVAVDTGKEPAVNIQEDVVITLEIVIPARVEIEPVSVPYFRTVPGAQRVRRPVTAWQPDSVIALAEPHPVIVIPGAVPDLSRVLVFDPEQVSVQDTVQVRLFQVAQNQLGTRFDLPVIVRDIYNLAVVLGNDGKPVEMVRGMKIDPCGKDPEPVVLEEHAGPDIVSLDRPAPVEVSPVVRAPARKSAVLQKWLDAGIYPVGFIGGNGVYSRGGDGDLRVEVRVLEILPEPEIRKDRRLHVRAVAYVKIIAQNK